MCGIAGIVGELSDANRASLGRMNDAMHHRGPDAEGLWESTAGPDGRGVLLAHRRLKILDLSAAAAQPMIDPVTGHVIVFNGEIYNYQELRQKLVAAGQTFASTGDTSVMLRAIALHGSAAVEELRGMFVFACWDPARRRLLLARDPLGIKPLYVVRSTDPRAGWSVAFASEVRALLASGLLGTPRLAPDAVASVAWNGFVVGPGCAVAGVDLLEAGHLVEIDDRGRTVAERDFWTMAHRDRAPPSDERELADVLEDGLRLHLASDVPLAVFLSGGIDSSAVANLAQRAARTPIHTFTLAFEEQELNEGPFARKIAEAIGTTHTEVVLTEGEFTGHLEAALDSLDQPTFDGLNAYYMSRAIRSAGFTVALVGTGGDELFGGYSSFRDLPILHRWLHRFSWMPLGAAALALGIGRSALSRAAAIPPQTRWAKLPAMIARGDDLGALYQMAYALFLPEFQRQLLRHDLRTTVADGLPAAFRARLERETGARTPLSAISVMEQRLFLGERLLRDNDVASMAASIEQRVPLVDRVLFDTVDRLPDRVRYDPVGKKSILRRIGLRGLPPSLFDRPKSGFVLPFDRWIRQGLRTTIDETLRDGAAVSAVGLQADAVRRLWQGFLDGAPGLYWSRVWALYVLVRWCHRHRVLV